MSVLRSLHAIAGSSGDGPVDWTAVADAAKASTPAGSIGMTEDELEGYRRDVVDAQRDIRTVSGLSFEVPGRLQIQNRHHWIDANVTTFRRIMRPVERRWTSVAPGASRVINTGTMAVMLSFLGKNVLGQYDPILLADGEDEDHELYFVHPNIVRVAEELEVDLPRFRRWIAYHEVAHAAEFGAAPWLSDHLESTMVKGIDALAAGRLDREAFVELDASMTAVEGFAELLMDRAFDRPYEDLREKLERRRRGGGPVARFVRRWLGLGLKRRQYERGKQFFETVADERGLDGASVVWTGPEALPDGRELDDPHRWLARVEGRNS